MVVSHRMVVSNVINTTIPYPVLKRERVTNISAAKNALMMGRGVESVIVPMYVPIKNTITLLEYSVVLEVIGDVFMGMFLVISWAVDTVAIKTGMFVPRVVRNLIQTVLAQ